MNMYNINLKYTNQGYMFCKKIIDLSKVFFLIVFMFFWGGVGVMDEMGAITDLKGRKLIK